MNRQAVSVTTSLLGLGLLIFFVVSANSSASRIEAEAEANENRAQSAPQQQVVASWAIGDATASAIRQNGITNGILAVAVVTLIGMAVGQSTSAPSSATSLVDAAAAGPVRECPHCKEPMRRDASVCPHCQQQSPPWRLHEGHWWSKDKGGVDRWFNEGAGTWVAYERKAISTVARPSEAGQDSTDASQSSKG
jgi:hypothetical protein